VSAFRVDGADVYEGLGPAATWAKICEQTGVQSRTMKVGGDMTWEEFASLAEAVIGLCLHERSVAVREADSLRAALSRATGGERDA
jgi:hypothetical protein